MGSQWGSQPVNCTMELVENWSTKNQISLSKLRCGAIKAKNLNDQGYQLLAQSDGLCNRSYW